MNENVNCGNAEPHMFHNYEADVHYHCSGEVECGAVVHEPHMFLRKNVKLWCRGICDCGVRGIPHGPGEHK